MDLGLRLINSHFGLQRILSVAEAFKYRPTKDRRYRPLACNCVLLALNI